ncbi:MAG: SoxR reducing system RseC family protein [Granulosicoccus sp.]|nr:SoxR reducing system RseC family protein [Granulosicoccus sp.]
MRRTGRVVAYDQSEPAIACDIDRDVDTSSSKYSGNAPARKVWVEIDGTSSCARCARGDGCGQVFYDQRRARIQLLCRTVLPVKPSQRVTVVIDDANGRWLWLVAGAYGLPLAGLLAGAALGAPLASALGTGVAGMALGGLPAVHSSAMMGELSSVIGALAGLIGGLFAWRRFSQRHSRQIEKDLCLHTARIEVVSAESLETK